MRVWNLPVRIESVGSLLGKRLGYATSFSGGGCVDPGSLQTLLAQPWPGYTGPNRKLGDYYVREIERIGTEHRQVVRYEIVGLGRIEQMPRSRFDKMVRPG